MIVDRQLIVSNRKRAEIVAELRTLDFRPFPKVAKAKSAGETEDVVEDEEEEGADSDYDYLLGMPIYSLTREKVGVHENNFCFYMLRLFVDRETQTTSCGQGIRAARPSRPHTDRSLE